METAEYLTQAMEVADLLVWVHRTTTRVIDTENGKEVYINWVNPRPSRHHVYMDAPHANEEERTMSESEDVTIRVSRKTRDRLKEVARSIVRQVEQGRPHSIEVSAETINPRACGVSLDQVIGMLLDQRDAHQERARRQRRPKA